MITVIISTNRKESTTAKVAASVAELIEKQGEVFNTWLFRLPDGYSVNHLIVHNLTNLELRSVQEMLPNMRDIFISAVTNTPIYSQSHIEEFSPEV